MQVFARAGEMPAGDGALVEAVLAGNDQAYRVLMERYLPLISAHLQAKLGSASDREDLTQEVFLTAYRRLATLRNREAFRPWLVKIAKNQLALHYRQPRVLPGEIFKGTEEPDPGPNPSQAAERAEFSVLVEQALGAMKEKYRLVLYLSLREGMPLVEVAAQLGLRESAARMRYLRGMKLLRERLERLGALPPD